MNIGTNHLCTESDHFGARAKAGWLREKGLACAGARIRTRDGAGTCSLRKAIRTLANLVRDLAGTNSRLILPDVMQYDALVSDIEQAVGQLARVLQELRAERRLSLDAASERAGISRRLLVALEHGDGNPSLGTLLRVAEGYGVGLADLLGASEKPPIAVRAAADARTLWETERGSRARLLIASEELEMWSWEMSPREVRTSDAHRPGTTEIVRMQRGRLTITVGDRREELAGTQVALFAGDQPHSFENPGSATSRFQLIVHEPLRR
jgi:transcriptional regulator with XRE-family HTH domain